MKNKIIKKEIDLNGKRLILETGELAIFADIAVKATYGDSVVLAAVTSADPNLDIDYWPLTVAYEERLYASGTIKSSRFVKRDGRPTDEAIVKRRLIDHAIRPLFPKDYNNQLQVAVTVMSLDKDSDPHVLGLIAVSAALHASRIPCAGPVISAKVGYKDNEFLLNPTYEELESSDLDMLISFVGDDKRYLAVEAKANILPEEKILGAINFARDNLDPVFNLITDFAKEVNPKGEKDEYISFKLDPKLVSDVSEIAKSKMISWMEQNLDKVQYKEKRDELFEEIYKKFEGKYKKSDMVKALSSIEEPALQHLILSKGKRMDGRGIKDIRPISCSVGILPRTHGSAVFTRGVTQSLTTATLNSPSSQQIIQDMYGEYTKRYIHYYNFPPYSVGEVGRMGFPGGREIGHGMLAERALEPVIPDQLDFPYMMLLTSEILSSSGSSSMAATCGSTLALMDAGVPIKDMVAGIGVGLMVSEDGKKQLIMTDLAYLEDAYGFLDFKMTGTKDGVTAIQSDMKLAGIPMDLMPDIIEQSREARLSVLEDMKKIIDQPRGAVSEYAPKLVTMKIPVDRIGVVIGSGGKTIKDIEAKTSATLGIESDGTVVLSGDSSEGIEKAVRMIEALTKEFEIGEIYEGKVVNIADFGAFVELLPGKDGLVHVSELAHDYVSSVSEVVSVGDVIKVKVIGVDGDRVSLSKKALEEASSENSHNNYDQEEKPYSRFSGRGKGGNKNRPRR